MHFGINQYTFSHRLACLQQYGDDPNVYATLQPNLSYFECEVGYIAYRMAFGGPVVLNDPVCDGAVYHELISAFARRFPRAIYLNITSDFGRMLSEVSSTHRFTPYGTEHILDTQTTGPWPKTVMGALKKAQKAQLRFEPLRWSDAALVAHLQKINQAFLERSSAGKELPFVARGLVFEREAGVRVFALCQGDVCFGVMTLDPWYRAGQLVGYQLNQVRFSQTKLWGVYYSLVAMLCEQLAREGVAYLSLGACLFHRIYEPYALPTHPLVSVMAQPLSSLAEQILGLSNITKMKLQFDGHQQRRFVAVSRLIPIVDVLRLLRAGRVI